jgi:hypothetical protein
MLRGIRQQGTHESEQVSGKAQNYADEQLFFIFVEKRVWAEAYDAFLTKRAEILADRLNDFIQLR